MSQDITYDMLQAQLETLESTPKLEQIEVRFHAITPGGRHTARFNRLMAALRSYDTTILGRPGIQEVEDKYVPEDIVVIQSPMSLKPGKCTHQLPPDKMDVYHSSGMCSAVYPRIINLANDAQWASVEKELRDWDKMWESIEAAGRR